MLRQLIFNHHVPHPKITLYCIVLYCGPVAFIFLLEQRASVKHRFTSVSQSRTVGRTPWISDQPIARPLPNTNTEYTYTNFHASVGGFEPRIPASERAKTVHTSDRSATVIGRRSLSDQYLVLYLTTFS
jgi:hypothetical protein